MTIFILQKTKHVFFRSQALVSAMLDVDPKKRPTALELCKHPWFAKMDSLPNAKLSNIQDYNLVRVSKF